MTESWPLTVESAANFLLADRSAGIILKSDSDAWVEILYSYGVDLYAIDRGMECKWEMKSLVSLDPVFARPTRFLNILKTGWIGFPAFS